MKDKNHTFISTDQKALDKIQRPFIEGFIEINPLCVYLKTLKKKLTLT